MLRSVVRFPPHPPLTSTFVMKLAAARTLPPPTAPQKFQFSPGHVEINDVSIVTTRQLRGIAGRPHGGLWHVHPELDRTRRLGLLSARELSRIGTSGAGRGCRVAAWYRDGARLWALYRNDPVERWSRSPQQPAGQHLHCLVSGGFHQSAIVKIRERSTCVTPGWCTQDRLEPFGDPVGW